MSLGKPDALKEHLKELSYLLAKNRLQEQHGNSSVISGENELTQKAATGENTIADHAVILSETVGHEKRPLSQSLELSLNSQQRKYYRPSYRDTQLEIYDLPVTEAVVEDFFQLEGQFHNDTENPLLYLDPESQQAGNSRSGRSASVQMSQTLSGNASSDIGRRQNHYNRVSPPVLNSEDNNLFKFEPVNTNLFVTTSNFRSAEPLEKRALKNIIRPCVDIVALEISNDSWDTLRSFSGSLIDIIGAMLKNSPASERRKLSREFLDSLFIECKVIPQDCNINDIFYMCSEFLCAEDLSELEIALFK
ncbi:LAQU0S14e02850g1_1 [Lachancea quebecensis]|uniref:LAQU0S14e02850g1_1 n=1 Tax=Lachancea quebecensis TaxID=1654605 RepID=A0A0P1KWB4_9SACH|nr:LAQU0S14e02850g1_1 [Lachancea quebecensis]